jgi:MFS family permease
MWILLFGAFITRGSYYMVWPFLAVILYQKFAISATEVGLILTMAAVVSVLIGFFGGALSDRFGRSQLMYFSGILYCISFSLLAEVDSKHGYIIVITLCSIATSIWQPPSSALIGDIIKDPKTRELAMQSLYFMVNVGSALGPMIGIWFGLTGQQSSFYITAVAFALLLLLLVWGFHCQAKERAKMRTSTSPDSTSDKQQNNKLVDTMKALLKDRLLQILIIANILCMFIYGQMDTSLIQYLTRANVPELLTLISAMIFTNALVIITSQFFLLRLMASLSLIKRIQIGLVLLTCSQIWLAFNPLLCFWGWICAVVIMSLAEAILFPTMNVHIDRIAPNHLRGAYFGAASFYSFGFALAPFGGGLVLDYLSGQWLFLMSAVLCLFVIYLYSIADKVSRNEITGSAAK